MIEYTSYLKSINWCYMLKEEPKFYVFKENDPIGVSGFRYISEISTNEVLNSDVTYNKKISIFSKDKFKCVVPGCGFVATRLIKARHKNGQIRYFPFSNNLKLITLDHIIPKFYGGTNEQENFQSMCKRCNNIKGNLPISLEELSFLIKLEKKEVIEKVKEFQKYQDRLKNG